MIVLSPTDSDRFAALRPRLFSIANLCWAVSKRRAGQVVYRTAQINGCAWCIDMHWREPIWAWKLLNVSFRNPMPEQA